MPPLAGITPVSPWNPSMALVYSNSRPWPARAPQGDAGQGLSLHFSGDSWIEILDREGGTLEQALVHDGDERRFDAGEVGAVVLGNASVVEVRQQGRVADLTPFLRANVARFTVSSDGSLAPATD